MKSFSLIFSLFIASSSFAAGNTGFVPPYVLEAIEKYKAEEASKAASFICQDAEAKYTFDSFSKTLTIGDRVISLKCDENEIELHPDQSATLYSCIEDRAGEGRFGFKAHLIGFLGVTLGEVTIEQMFPLPAYKLANFPCQN